MTLRGQPPNTVKKRLKCLLYSAAGVGKTSAVSQFNKLYMIDTERGAENDEYVNRLVAGGSSYLFLNDFNEVTKEVLALLQADHDYQTVAIDSMTTIYNDLVDSERKKLARLTGKDESDPALQEYGRDRAVPNRKMKHMMNLLTRLDMNVIVTSHEKADFATQTKTFDCFAKLDYMFDLVLELQKRGKERVAIVKKTRIAGFPDGDCFPFSYDAVAERYGREDLERRSVAVELASADQLKHINELFELKLVPRDTLDKWLEKAGAESFEEMQSDQIAKCISYLETQAEKVGK